MAMARKNKKIVFHFLTQLYVILSQISPKRYIMNRPFKFLLVSILAIPILHGCFSNAVTPNNTTQTGVATGALAGALIGANTKGSHKGKRIAIGAVAGAVLGGVTGNAIDGQTQQVQQTGGWQ